MKLPLDLTGTDAFVTSTYRLRGVRMVDAGLRSVSRYDSPDDDGVLREIAEHDIVLIKELPAPCPVAAARPRPVAAADPYRHGRTASRAALPAAGQAPSRSALARAAEPVRG
jgi:hypothetical protein